MRHAAVLAALIAASSLAFSGGALAQAQPTTPAKPQVSQTKKSDAATARYVREAAIGDKFEIEFSKVALVKLRNNAVKDFARMMVKDHTASTKKIKDAVKTAKLDVKPSTMLDTEHQKMLAELKKTDEMNFDRVYMEMQVKGHNRALALHQRYANAGPVSELKAAATEIVPIVQRHLEDANRLSAVVNSNSPTTMNPTTGLPRKGS